jgi:hypothetical protein
MTKQKHEQKTSQLGRPVTIDADRYIGLRLPSDLLNKIDDYAGAGQVPRSEALRELLERGLLRAGAARTRGVGKRGPGKRGPGKRGQRGPSRPTTS